MSYPNEQEQFGNTYGGGTFHSNNATAIPPWDDPATSWRYTDDNRVWSGEALIVPAPRWRWYVDNNIPVPEDVRAAEYYTKERSVFFAYEGSEFAEDDMAIAEESVFPHYEAAASDNETISCDSFEMEYGPYVARSDTLGFDQEVFEHAEASAPAAESDFAAEEPTGVTDWTADNILKLYKLMVVHKRGFGMILKSKKFPGETVEGLRAAWKKHKPEGERLYREENMSESE